MKSTRNSRKRDKSTFCLPVVTDVTDVHMSNHYVSIDHEGEIDVAVNPDMLVLSIVAAYDAAGKQVDKCASDLSDYARAEIQALAATILLATDGPKTKAQVTAAEAVVRLLP